MMLLPSRIRWTRLTALSCLCVLAACAQPIDYQPDPGAMPGFSRRQREQVFVETLSRARKPRIAQVWIDDVAYGHDDGRVVRGAFGEPLGEVAARRIVYFVNIGRLQLFTNHAVFVYDTSGRLIDKLVFFNQSDAQAAMDAIEVYRAMRVDPREYDRRHAHDDDRPLPNRQNQKHRPHDDDRDGPYPYDDRYDDRRNPYDDDRY